MKRTKSTVAWVMAGLAVASLMALAGCSRQPAGDAQPGKQSTPASSTTGPDLPVRVKALPATRQISTPQPAQVSAYEKTDIYAKVAGYVHRLGPALGRDRKPLLDKDGKPRPLDIGDRVEKNQLLVKLWVPEMEKELELKKALHKQAEADVKKYEAERVFREAEFARLEKMVKDRSIQEAVLDEKRLQRDAVQAAIAAAQARVQVAMREAEYVEELLNYASIKAPYDGIITRRLVDTGAFVQSAKPEPLFTLARVDRLRIVTPIPEAEASLVKIGQPATFQVNAARGQPLTGKIVRYADALDIETRTMRTEVELDVPANNLRPGMFGSVTIIGAILLPTSALVPSAAKTAVLVVEKGKAHRREVELGREEGGRVEVIRGLNGDEQVITDGKNTVREGQAVEIAK